jgi:hypothetical protein
MSDRTIIINTVALLGICVFELLSGCKLSDNQDNRMQQHQSKVDHRISDAQARPVNMLAYYHWLQQSTAKELKHEYERIEVERSVDMSRQNQLMLALLLSLPDRPLRDDYRATTLVEGFLDEQATGDDSDEAFALFLRDLLKERERYEQKMDKLERHVKDYALMKEELEKEREMREKLENQMKQLKDFEQNLIEREHSKVLPLTGQEDGSNGKSQGTPGR